MVTPVAGVFPPPTARRVGGEHGDVRVRQAGGVHLLLRAQGDASEEAVLLRTPVEVVELPGCGEQPRKLLQIQQGLLVHPHPAALPPGVPRLALAPTAGRAPRTHPSAVAAPPETPAGHAATFPPSWPTSIAARCLC
eukprot:4332206-Pyramimonas_sp.AAC.1